MSERRFDREFHRRLEDFRRQWLGDFRSRQLLRLNISGLKKILGTQFDTDLEREHGINRDHLREAERDYWHQLSRSELQILMELESQAQARLKGDERTRNDIFRILQSVPNPLWKTLDRSITIVCRPGSREILARTVGHKFEDAGLEVEFAPEGVDVVNIMRQANTLFIGSPEHNSRVSVAMEAMWPDGQPKVMFLSSKPPKENSGQCLIHGRSGIRYLDHENQFVDVHDVLPESPVGVLIARRSPLDATAEVTTLVCAGPHRLGTLRVVHDVLNRLIYVWQTQLKPGRPDVFILQPKSSGARWINVFADRERKQWKAERADKRRTR